MAAYLVIDRLVATDPGAIDAYQLRAAAAVKRYKGRYVLSHRTETEALEGNWKPDRVVVIEFEDAEQARQWWDSVEYAGARPVHQETTISNIIPMAGASW